MNDRDELAVVDAVAAVRSVEPDDHASARATLHAVAAHVLARRRFEVSGRFGLRAAPGGIATPAFGDAPEAIRISGGTLVHEVGSASTWTPIDGATLAGLAVLAGADLDRPFNCGDDGPPLERPNAPIRWLPDAAARILGWFSLGWRVLDAVTAAQSDGVQAATIQLWPEHFDAATTLTFRAGAAVNLGFSPGDGYEPEPYLYVGPWADDRPGDPRFWNASFGALRRYQEVMASTDPWAECLGFLEEGVRLVTSDGS